jgi:hypothetical protein
MRIANPTFIFARVRRVFLEMCQHGGNMEPSGAALADSAIHNTLNF